MRTNYYLIGSKYEEDDGNWADMFPEMQKRSVVSVGWERKHSLKRYYGKSQKQILKYWEDNQLSSKSFSVFKHFLNLKPGDLIAIKSDGSPKGPEPYLSIVGYAVVTERDGEIYHHTRNKIGHMINVDYLGNPVFTELALGYGRTIHQLKNREHIDQIFSGIDISSLNLTDENDDDEKESHLNTSDQFRSGTKPYVAKAAHNILQQRFYIYLSHKYGERKVKLEKDYIDIKLIDGNQVTIYEVKPYNSVTQCIRQAIGQLLQYSYRISSESRVSLAVVGPSNPNGEDVLFLKHLKQVINIPLKYICCTLNDVKEY